MQFFLQQGHGMLALNREFVAAHPEVGVIMSPRSCTREQIERHAAELHRRNTAVLFDPQFYQPRTERENILAYPYWDDMNFATTDFAATGAAKLCEGVIRYQVHTLEVERVILPGRYTNAVTEEWLALHHTVAEAANSMSVGRPLYATIALGPDVVSEKQFFDRVLDEVVGYPVDGVYIVLKAPSNDFLVTNELYLYNLLDGFLSLRLAGKDIIVGYANQQSLIYAAAGVTGLASGNFRNVRAFDPEMFDVQEPTDVIQRAVWYYDADTLSEYRLAALGLAYNRGMAGSFGPTCSYCESLLNAANPATVLWREPDAFRHYLTEICRQWLEFSTVATSSRLRHAIDVVTAVQTKIAGLTARGFNPGQRSFSGVADPTLSALVAFEADRQAQLSLL